MKVTKKLFVVLSVCMDSSWEQNAFMPVWIFVVPEEIFIRVEDNMFLHEEVRSWECCREASVGVQGF